MQIGKQIIYSLLLCIIGTLLNFQPYISLENILVITYCFQKYDLESKDKDPNVKGK